jgi:GntR family transcriptional regulator
LPPTDPLIKLERLRLSGNEPCAIETCYFSADEFAGLTQARLDRTSLFSILEHDYGFQIAHADEEVDATTADAQTARLLEVTVGTAVLRIRQKIYSTRGRPGVYVLGLYRSDRHSLFIRRFR